MIQVQTELQVADNTGAKKIECIKVLGGSKRRYASIGDTIVIAVKEAIPKGKVKKGSVHKAVVVRVKKGIHRDDGSKVRFDNNAAVLVDDKGEPVGTSVTISGLDGNYSLIKLASGEVRKIDSRSLATIGVLSNPDQKNIKIGKAGRSRWLGRRPHTRGVVKNPVDHPHGGGEGKSAGGRHPVSPKGQSAKGLKTRDNKRTDKFIVKRRNKRKDSK